MLFQTKFNPMSIPKYSQQTQIMTLHLVLKIGWASQKKMMMKMIMMTMAQTGRTLSGGTRATWGDGEKGIRIAKGTGRTRIKGPPAGVEREVKGEAGGTRGVGEIRVSKGVGETREVKAVGGIRAVKGVVGEESKVKEVVGEESKVKGEAGMGLDAREEVKKAGLVVTQARRVDGKEEWNFRT